MRRPPRSFITASEYIPGRTRSVPGYTVSASPHPGAPAHLPFYVPGPDGSDPVLVGAGIFLFATVLTAGLLMLRLHHLPEHIAHRGQKVQYEIVAVLGLLSMFTGVHAFWVGGLLLALLDLPDFTGPLHRIAGSAERIADLAPGGGDKVNDPSAAPDVADLPHSPRG